MTPDALMSALNHPTVRKPLETVPSGSLSTDIALGGGLPKGRVTEVQGEAACGKTSLLLAATAAAQKFQGTVVWFDLGNEFSPDQARKAGVSTDRLLVVPVPGEYQWGSLGGLKADLIVFDGAPAPGIARQIDALVPHVAGTILCSTQTRSQIVRRDGCTMKPSEGGGWLSSASVRIQLRNEGTNQDGIHVLATIKENPFCPPDSTRFGAFDISYGHGIDHDGEMLDLLLRTDIVEIKPGYRYYLGGTDMGHGWSAARDWVKSSVLKNTLEGYLRSELA